MKKRITKRVLILVLAIVMCVSICISLMAVTGALKATATDAEAEFSLDMTASTNANDSSIIDVMITVKDIKQELVAVEFNLNFDKSLVAGVITENDEAQMDAFMTTNPMYDFSYSGVTASLPRYEQICYYDAANGLYECRFVDLLDYPYAVEGQEFPGLINDGDLVVTIQFQILDGVAEDAEFSFSATNVKGTTKVGLDSVPGIGDGVVYTAESGKFDIAMTSMTMGNSLAMNFAFEKSAVSDWTGHYAVITKTYADGRANVVETVNLADWKTANIGGVAHYYVTFNGIAAKEMTDDINVVIYNADGNAVSNVYTDSVAAQSVRILAKSTTSAKEKTMIVDMLNYGAAAQEYFSYNKTDLANAALTEAQKALASAPKTCTDSRVKGTNYVATNVVLQSNIQMMFAFKNIDTTMSAKVTFTNHRGVAKEVTINGSDFTKNGSYYVVTVEDLVAADGRQAVTCVVYDANGNQVANVSDSLESYTARKNGAEDIFVKMMQYSDSAYAYFH